MLVLVVDDEPLIRMGTAMMLEDLGHVVVEANSGLAGLEICLQMREEIGLVITDQSMPGMLGSEFAERLKSSLPKMPIIVATGYSDLPSGFPGGFPRLAKPFRLEDLSSAIDDIFASIQSANP